MEASIELKKPVRGFSEEAAELFSRYSWPGNVRELKNIVRQAALFCGDLVEREHLSALMGGVPFQVLPDAGIALDDGVPLKELRQRAVETVERQVIRRVLQQTNGNKSRAAKILDIDFKTLYSKMKQYGIQSREFLS